MGDRLYMAASVLIRMGAGLLVFVLMARGLGPAAYGLVATVFAYATLASVLTDFGFASKSLRDIAADRDNGGAILNASLSVKVYLTAAVMAVGGVILLLAPGDPVTRLAAGLLGAAVLIGAIGDLALTAYRAVGRYSGETWLTIWTSVIHLCLVGWISLVHGDLLVLAIAFVASRLLYAVVAVIGAGRLFTGHSLRPKRLREAWTSIRGAWGWAADSGMSYFNGQIDGLIVAVIFGLPSAGVYQSGGRFVQAAFSMSAILSAVHIPRLARSDSPKLRWRAFVEFGGAGLLFALFFVFVGPLITRFVLGPEYRAVDQLWPAFGAFACARFIAAGLGCILSAEGRPSIRVVGQVLGLAISCSLFLSPLMSFGYGVIPWIMAASAVSTAVVYASAVVNLKMRKAAAE